MFVGGSVFGFRDWIASAFAAAMLEEDGLGFLTRLCPVSESSQFLSGLAIGHGMFDHRSGVVFADKAACLILLIRAR